MDTFSLIKKMRIFLRKRLRRIETRRTFVA